MSMLHVPITKYLVERLHNGVAYKKEWITNDEMVRIIRDPSAPDYFPLGDMKYVFVCREVEDVEELIEEEEPHYDTMYYHDLEEYEF